MSLNPRVAWPIALVVLVALPFVHRDTYHLHIVILILIWSFAYTSWSMMGRFGLVSLGHGGALPRRAHERLASSPAGRTNIMTMKKAKAST